MNNQEVFTKVVKHLLTQNQKSEDGHICLYRGANGTSCAIGCLIPDEIYDPKMEANTVNRLLSGDRFPQLNLLFREVDVQLIGDLQNVHDEKAPVEWQSALRDVASKYKLQFTEEK